MSEPLTDAELAEMEARCQAATPGPWLFFGPTEHAGLCYVEPSEPGPRVASTHNNSRSCQNATFIARARADVPRLLAEVRRLRGVIIQHDLCHDLHGKVDARAFADGCAQEQRKLYGCAPDADEVTRLREQIKQARRDELKACEEALLRLANAMEPWAEANGPESVAAIKLSTYHNAIQAILARSEEES